VSDWHCYADCLSNWLCLSRSDSFDLPGWHILSADDDAESVAVSERVLLCDCRLVGADWSVLWWLLVCGAVGVGCCGSEPDRRCGRGCVYCGKLLPAWCICSFHLSAGYVLQHDCSSGWLSVHSWILLSVVGHECESNAAVSDWHLLYCGTQYALYVLSLILHFSLD
jgi:hypothetical protein